MTEIPEQMLYNLVVPYALEDSNIEWHTDDEVREDMTAHDLCSYSNLEKIDQREDGEIQFWFEDSATVSERVARKTHWHPAEYKNHDVTIHATVSVKVTDDLYDESVIWIEQETFPTEPPSPDI